MAWMRTQLFSRSSLVGRERNVSEISFVLLGSIIHGSKVMIEKEENKLQVRICTNFKQSARGT